MALIDRWASGLVASLPFDFWVRGFSVVGKLMLLLLCGSVVGAWGFGSGFVDRRPIRCEYAS